MCQKVLLASELNIESIRDKGGNEETSWVAFSDSGKDAGGLDQSVQWR